MFEVPPKFVFSVFSYHVLWNEQIAFFVKKQIGHKRIIVYFNNSAAFTFNFLDIRTVVESVSAYATQRFWENQAQYFIAVSEGIWRDIFHAFGNGTVVTASYQQIAFDYAVAVLATIEMRISLVYYYRPDTIAVQEHIAHRHLVVCQALESYNVFYSYSFYTF